MKPKTAGIVCVLVVIGAWVYVHAQTAAQPALPTGPNGRYEVVALDFDETVFSGEKYKSAIRIDTQTGRTWEMMEVPSKSGSGGHSLVWLGMISEDK
jgi:hypothetical protein